MRIVVNGDGFDIQANPLARLLDVLRDELGLTGTKEGCGEGECGACTVLIDDTPVCSCLVPVAQVGDSAITTIEGLGRDHPLPQAFAQTGAVQCGFCTPGMILAATKLRRSASIKEIKRALAGNLCRCTGYSAIYRAVQRAR